MNTIKQSILKIFLWTLVTTAIFGLVYLFLSYYDKENTILPRFIQNQNYLIFLYVSIILWYSFSISHSKFANFLLWFIIIVNFFAAGRFFMNGQIWLWRQQFIILFGILIAGLLVSYINHRIRYILISIISIWFLVVLLISVIPTYNNPLDIQKLYDTQPITLSILFGDSAQDIAEANPSIKTVNQDGEKKLSLSKWTDIIAYDIADFVDTQITFSTQKKLEKTNLIISAHDGWLIMMKSQSALKLVKSWSIIISKIMDGDVYTYSDTFTWSADDMAIFEDQRKNFEQKKLDYITNLAWWNIVLNPTVDLLIKNYITVLMNIDQNRYAQNMMNYNEYHKYLKIDNKAYRYETGQEATINAEISYDAQAGIEQTKFLKTIFGRFK